MSATDNTVIAVDNVVAGYTRDVDILRGLSIEVRQREIVTLLGPNGCGKSTLLKTVAGVLLPRQGRVLLEGRDRSAMPVHHKVATAGLGFVPQTDNVFGALSVRENLQLGGHFMPEREATRRIEELGAMYPVLLRKMGAPASSLSGGERQILALARALMPRPRLLLLDEPSAGLSPKMLHEVFDAIVHIRNGEQLTVLMVEQNAIEALRISERAYVLALGQVALSGSAAALAADPQVRELYLGGRAA